MVCHRICFTSYPPLTQKVGIALAPWQVLGAGRLRSDAEEQRREQSGEQGRSVSGEDWRRTDEEKRTCRALEKVAGEIGAKNFRSGMYSI